MATSNSGERPAKKGLRGAVGGALGGGRGGASDHLTILSGTAQNIAGLIVFALAGFAINILIARSFKTRGADVLGVVTVATQFAFIAAAATRFGMDMAATRRVAIEAGKGEAGRSRAIVRKAVGIAALVSVAVGVLVFAGAGWLASQFNTTTPVFQAVAVALPFVALCQTYVAASRGLKIMSHTLWAYWIGQSVSWIVFSIVGWRISKTAAMTVLAYAASWVLGTVIAWALWHRSTARFERMPAESGETGALVRYGAPRAPAALLSQAIFWTDYFVLSLYTHGPAAEVERGVYAASVKVALMLVLFLTAVSYMFSPFVADLHEKGERQRLDGLFKAITRWTLALTLPILLLLMVVPGPVLHIFGAQFTSGTTALRILLVGQIVNVSVGAAGFVLIMAKRTGWDLIVYIASFVLDVTISVTLIGGLGLGMNGAAIAQTTTIIFANALRIFLVWRFVGIHPYNRYYFKLAVPFVVGLVVMVAVNSVVANATWPVELLVTGIVGTAAYGAVFLLVCLTPTERAALRRLVGREQTAGT